MKLSLMTYQLGSKFPLDELIQVCRDVGCAGIEFRIQQGHQHGVDITLNENERQHVRRAMEDAFLGVSSIATGCSFHHTDEETRREHIENAKAAAQLAADLGSERIRVFGNVIPEGVNAQDCVAQVGESLAEVADFAKPLGVDVLLEMHGQFNFWGYALSAVEKADRSNVGLIYNSDKRDIVGGSISETWERVAPLVRHVHLHEISDPVFPYQQLFDLLVIDGYEGYVSAEIQDSPDNKRVFALFAACYKAMVRAAERGL